MSRDKGFLESIEEIGEESCMLFVECRVEDVRF